MTPDSLSARTHTDAGASSDSSVLPRGWALSDLASVVAPSVEQRPPTKPVRYIDIGSVDRRTKTIGETEMVSARSAPTRARQWVKEGDILVSLTRPNLNAVAMVPAALNEAVASTGFDVLRPHGVLPEWILLRVRSSEFIADICKDLQGVVYPAVRPRDVRRHELPIPPLIEQRRIIEIAASHLSRLDEAEAALERVRRNLNRYHAAVLQAAVEGRLVPTAAELARVEGRTYEPASELLKRILAERRRRWEEAELARLKAAGKVPNDDRWKAKYEEPPPVDDGVIRLPEGWSWASVDQLGEVSGGLTKNPQRHTLRQRLPYLRVANVYADELRLEDLQTIGVADSEIQRTLLHRGDLLVVEGNGSLDQIGRVAVWNGSIHPCLHQNHIIKVRFSPPTISAWALCWLLSPPGRGDVQRVASSTSGLHTLSLSKVGSLPVPVPPLAEQIRIQAEIDRCLTVIRALAKAAETAEQRLRRLRQSILKWAFEGKLVDQDPTDEPASVLLDRIRAERATQAQSDSKKAGRDQDL